MAAGRGDLERAPRTGEPAHVSEIDGVVVEVGRVVATGDDRRRLGPFALTLQAGSVLGDDGIQREGERLAKWAAGTPFAGFYTYGEIARTRGMTGVHNQTLVVLALS